MRKIRTTTISVLAIGLLAGSAIGVAAQGDSDGTLEPTLTSGSLVFSGSEPLSWEERLQDGVQTEDWVDSAAIEMSDPRLSGALTLDYTKQRFDTRNTDLAWGSARIENDAGAWEGMMRQTSDRDALGAEVGYYELVGSGAYEGLSAIVFETETPTDREWTGIIFPGDLPPDR